MTKAKSLVGAATRYIAGRNSLQTVYWRSNDLNTKMIKVSKTLQFGKTAMPPQHVQNGKSAVRFN